MMLATNFNELFGIEKYIDIDLHQPCLRYFLKEHLTSGEKIAIIDILTHVLRLGEYKISLESLQDRINGIIK